MRLGRHVDDGAFLGVRVDVLAVFGVDPAGGYSARRFGVARPVAVGAGAIAFERWPVRQVGVEQDLQIGPQRG
jgi:hypothetical protein